MPTLSAADCAAVTESELRHVCAELSAQIDGIRTPLLWTAIGAALLAVLGSIAVAWFNAKATRSNDQATRRDTADRAAVYAAQDAATELMSRWQALQSWIREGGPPAERPLSESAESAAIATFTITVGRVPDDDVRDALIGWSDYAARYFNEADETSEATHAAHWSALEKATNGYVHGLERRSRPVSRN